MKRIFTSVVACLLCSSALATNLQRPIDKIINQIDPNINMGMMVVDLNTGETLYQRNATNTFTPASNMKLFSDAAALLVLGPDYRFQSRLSTDATSLRDGILTGSLYLYLPGDPSFTQGHLDILFAQLPTWGIHRIQGNVVLVSDHSTIAPHAPGVVPNDLTYSYGAPTAPLMVDENRLTVTVNPSYRVGEPAIIEYSAPNDTFVLDNHVKTAAAASHCGVGVKTTSDNHLLVQGCISLGQGAVQARIPIAHPLSYAQVLIRNRLENVNVTLDGQVLLGQPPQKTLLLATHASKPITQLMADTLKPSDNLYADSLFLHAAETIHGSPLNWQQSQPIVKNFLQQQTGINLQNAVLIDGSGLSRQDLLTPLQTVGLLRYLHDRFPLAYEYIAALPIAGQDGTLLRRFRKPTQRGFLRAKTGSMTGIMSLSGYLYSANAHTLAFAIYINTRHGTSPSISGRYRGMVDALCDFLLQQKPDNKRVTPTANPHARVAFQQQPSLSDKTQVRHAKWRRIEYALKQALKNQPISIIFRNEQLVLIDHGADVNRTWSAIQSVGKKYSFAVALHGKSAPTSNKQMPLLMWVNNGSDNLRTWYLRETVG
ncbi:MAG: D-alanyl-D-alanine carboxypeptidase/D-alanyl-D-alanine-endopeptidase [Legionellaceae bacterium]|nr:D-alanyl-D-alanine carboxypeptidase/D-alanyl-D-alanine-endopeptidase [Legionellaceae bacterium]